jgi:NAD(P)-dependent dehydrogenase (short-subunit alcohol dehydrogenase family)
MFDLTNKTALVTGAGSGIGAEIARTLARAGAHVFLADRDEAAGQSVTAQIVGEKQSAEFLPLDVTSESDWQKAAHQVLHAGRTLDILVNNAGIGFVGTILQTGGEDLDRMYEVNVRGVFNGCKQFVPHMIENGGGSIINLASVGGVVGIVDRLAYCTTKFAVVGLTKCLALDHAKTGLRVNCLCPGRVETPFVQARLREYPDPAAAYKEMSESQAVGRMGRPEEIAAAALYLASDEAAFVTGSALIIDGGHSAG